jgi:hypothetical protein
VRTAAEVMRVPSVGRYTRTANSSMAESTITEPTAATDQGPQTLILG